MVTLKSSFQLVRCSIKVVTVFVLFSSRQVGNKIEIWRIAFIFGLTALLTLVIVVLFSS